MDPQYGERYRELYEKHWWWRARAKLIAGELRRLQPAQGWKNILDIGCGDGLFFPELMQFGAVEGVEPSSELVSPSNPYRSRIHVCPFDENFQPGKQYSLILMLDVLEHMENPVGALRRLAGLLTADGIFVATVPAFMALWTNHDVINQHFTRYTKSGFRKVAQQAGLRIKEERYYYQWTCPVKYAIGFLERGFHLEPEPASVPSPLLNEALFLLSRLEQKTLSRLPMPVGSSLMVVARKDSAQ